MLHKLLFFLLAMYGFCATAGYDMNARCRDAYQCVMSLRFKEGKALLEKEKKEHPSNDIPYSIENTIDFLTLFIAENREEFKRLEKNKEPRLTRLQKGDKSSPWYRHSIALVQLQWAFARIKFGEYRTAALEINKAYRLLEENRGMFPSFIPDDVSMGILHTLIGTIPDNYKWLINLMSFKGTVKQGKVELQKVLGISLANPSFAYLKNESLFFLTFIYLNLQSDKKDARTLFEKYCNKAMLTECKQDPLLTYCMASICLRTGNNNKAIEILKNRTLSAQYFPFHYLDYLTGNALLHSLDKDASFYYLRFLQNFRGQNYIKSAYQRLAWSFLLRDDEKTYREMLAKALCYGNSNVDEDKEAEKEARSGESPNIYLLKSRLLFDGGYYERALGILTNQKTIVSFTTSRLLTEMVYRKARICHEWGKTADAIPLYEQAIRQGKDEEWYFAANAALQLGMIYETAGNYTKAGLYYRQCLAMNPSEYKNSIHQKAKAGLNRIK
ncbi:MAG: hypothetical protein M0R21_01460 [Lentimicrobiaceae bacterium]|nr:hypothetical protein [Lentimicrobiaceae bacterium]